MLGGGGWVKLGWLGVDGCSSLRSNASSLLSLLQPHLAQNRLRQLLVLPAVAADAAELDAVQREPGDLIVSYCLRGLVNSP